MKLFDAFSRGAFGRRNAFKRGAIPAPDGGGALASATAYVDTGAGDDGTAELDNPLLPYFTAQAAFDALSAAAPLTAVMEAVSIAAVWNISIPTAPGFSHLIVQGYDLNIAQITQDADVALEIEWNVNVGSGVIHRTSSYTKRTQVVTYSGTGVLASFDCDGVDGATGESGPDDNQSGAIGDAVSGFTGYPGGTATGGAGGSGGNGGHASPFHFGPLLTITTINGTGGNGGDGGGGGSASANGGQGGDDTFTNPYDGGPGGTATGGQGGAGGNGGNGATLTCDSGFTYTSYDVSGGIVGSGGPGGGASANGGSPNAFGGNPGASGTATPGSSGSAGSNPGSNGSFTVI